MATVADFDLKGTNADRLALTLDMHNEGLRFFESDTGQSYRWDGSAWDLIADASLAGITLDTDGTLAANSDTKVASQKAVKTFVGAAVTGLLDLKGSTDCSANPNYPAASKGDAYIVSVAGKIGGASGKSVDVGDFYIASADNAGGTEGSVGTSWVVIEHNLIGALLAANNLNDLASAVSARANLGVEAAKADVASGSTTNIGAAATMIVRITGTTTITAFDSVADGIWRHCYFSGTLTLTHNATSLILPGGADIITAAGDSMIALSLGSGNWKILVYQKADGTPIAGGGGGGITLDQADPYGIHHRLTGSNSDDDEFSSDTSASYTQINPTGTVNWVIAHHALTCLFSGQFTADAAAFVKAMTLADGEWFEVRLKGLAKNVNYTFAGIIITDGTSNTSNAISGQITKIGTVTYLESYKGTVTNLSTVIASAEKFGPEAFAGIRLRLRRVSSTNFICEVSTDDGAQWSAFGNSGGDPGFTPTHAGVFVTVYGTSITSMVAFDFIRHMS